MSLGEKFYLLLTFFLIFESQALISATARMSFNLFLIFLHNSIVRFLSFQFHLSQNQLSQFMCQFECQFSHSIQIIHHIPWQIDREA